MSNLDARIDVVGLSLDPLHQGLLQDMANNLRKVFKVSNLKVKLIKAGRIIEGMVWCEVNHVPIGVYSRHTSIQMLIEMLFKKVSKDCKKHCKLNFKENTQRQGHKIFANNEIGLTG